MKSNERILLTNIFYRGEERELLILLDGADHPLEIHVNNPRRPSLVGNIYIARVSRVAEQIGGAFLSAGDLTFFCPLESVSRIHFTHKKGNPQKLCQGDEMVVQIVRDAIKSKEICATTNLSFSSKHVVLTTQNPKRGISAKIKGQKRRSLKEFLQEFAELPYGIVLRTSAKDASLCELRQEISSLAEESGRFLKTALHRQCGELLHEAPHPFYEHLHRLSHEVLDEVVTSQKEWYDRLKKDDFITCTLRQYEDKEYPLEKLYNLEAMLQHALEPKVWLPGGGYLLIEPTETLTAIDVNSGKNISKKSSADYYAANNREAAQEIARQLRLRNISGMILVDFINMEDEDENAALMSYMRSLTSSDYARVDVLDYTKLGLLELTRAKKYPPLAQQLGCESIL